MVKRTSGSGHSYGCPACGRAYSVGRGGASLGHMYVQALLEIGDIVDVIEAWEAGD